MFDPKTIIALDNYVYMLQDPVANIPFYVGKGTGNRVFDHLNCALKDLDAVTAKYETIRNIVASGRSVLHLIIRHGMDVQQAKIVEASIIDMLRYTGHDLSNLVSGYGIQNGLMTTNALQRLYSAEPLDSFPENCVLISISKQYERTLRTEEIYLATKGVWAMKWKMLVNKDGSILRKYVLSEFRGLILEVFEVDEWYIEPRGYGPNTKKAGKSRAGTGFNGRVASDEIRALFINKSVAHLKKPGSAISHRYTLVKPALPLENSLT